MHFRKIVASILIGTSLFSLCACSEDPAPPPPPPQNDAFVVLQDSVADLFNAGIEKLAAVKSYTMTGDLTSSAELTSTDKSATNTDTGPITSSESTTNNTHVELTYQDGKIYVDSMDATIDPHRTYFDGERYYFELPSEKYFTLANDHTDFGALDYLIPINSEVVMEPKLVENPDGTREVSFKMPFNIYQSPALEAWLGVVFDESFAADTVYIKIILDSDGYITQFYTSYVNDTSFGDDPLRRDIVAKMTLTNYNQSEVVAPTDLAQYEDWTEEIPTGETVPVGGLSPEDVQ